MPRGRALGALCAEKPLLASAIVELNGPQVRRLPVCISRVDTTHKRLSHCEALGPPRPLIFERAICATHAHSPSARSIGFCVTLVVVVVVGGGGGGSSGSEAHARARFGRGSGGRRRGRGEERARAQAWPWPPSRGLRLGQLLRRVYGLAEQRHELRRRSAGQVRGARRGRGQGRRGLGLPRRAAGRRRPGACRLGAGGRARRGPTRARSTRAKLRT